MLGFFREMARYRKDRSHLLWEDATGKPVYSEQYLGEAIEYIHDNPVRTHGVWPRIEQTIAILRLDSMNGGREITVIPVEDIRERWFLPV